MSPALMTLLYMSISTGHEYRPATNTRSWATVRVSAQGKQEGHSWKVKESELDLFGIHALLHLAHLYLLLHEKTF